MVEPKIDDRAYYYDRFYRHGVFKSGAYGLTKIMVISVGTMMVFSTRHAYAVSF